MPAASAGETWGRSPTLCGELLLMLFGVAGRDELGELTDGGYHEFVVISCGLGSPCSWEPLKGAVVIILTSHRRKYK